MVVTWIKGFDEGLKYALYCSDVSGAFDRVTTERLCQKLAKAGVPRKWWRVFRSWLRHRPARVAVGGMYSKDMTLKDMVFQGTVWGPQFWNSFFADAKLAIQMKGFIETVVADDLAAYKAFQVKDLNENLSEEAEGCQDELHNGVRRTKYALIQ